MRRRTSAVGEDAALPAPSTSLVRLAVWVRSRLRAADRERAGEEMAFAARLGAGLAADVIAFDRAGSAWVLTLALAALPDVDTLYVWARELIALHEMAL